MRWSRWVANGRSDRRSFRLLSGFGLGQHARRHGSQKGMHMRRLARERVTKGYKGCCKTKIRSLILAAELMAFGVGAEAQTCGVLCEPDFWESGSQQAGEALWLQVTEAGR